MDAVFVAAAVVAVALLSWGLWTAARRRWQTHQYLKGRRPSPW